MKLPDFVYVKAMSVDEALSAITDAASEEPRVLAGGQTLVPAMALRLARPSHVIDINRIQALEVLAERSSRLDIGACVRHAAFHRPACAGPLGDLLATVVHHIAHLPIRHRGTFCGSLANADASSEWCLVSVTLGAEFVVRSIRRERRIAASEFFLGFMTTALEPDEFLVCASLPLLSANTRFGFVEFSRRAGDFAQAMALVVFELEAGRMTNVRIGVGGVEAAPRRLVMAERCLEGQAFAEPLARAAAEAAAAEAEPAEATSELVIYKRRLLRAAVERAVRQASTGASTPT